MVRLTTWLSRVPVIKFRKGGAGKPGGSPVAAKGGGSCPVGAAPVRDLHNSCWYIFSAFYLTSEFYLQASQPAAAMSTGAAIPDIDLPARYRRTPLSDEEIDHINGGGIV